mgnify:CR=1 FL=1
MTTSERLVREIHVVSITKIEQQCQNCLCITPIRDSEVLDRNDSRKQMLNEIKIALRIQLNNSNDCLLQRVAIEIGVCINPALRIKCVVIW